MTLHLPESRQVAFDHGAVTRHPLLGIGNKTKERLRSGQVTLGMFVLSGSPIVVECCSTLPIDWLLIDGEASPISKETVLQLFQAISGSGVTPILRVEALNHHSIEHALDIGAHGILVPKVEDAAMARRVVDACFYPPVGKRGINPVRASGYFSAVPEYLNTAAARTLCMVQIESAEAVTNAHEIAAVEHIHVLFIGPGDLASSLGQPGIVTGPAMDEARAAVLRATAEHGKQAGIFAYSIELAQQYIDEGFRFVAFGNDLKVLRDGILRNLDALVPQCVPLRDVG